METAAAQKSGIATSLLGPLQQSEEVTLLNTTVDAANILDLERLLPDEVRSSDAYRKLDAEQKQDFFKQLQLGLQFGKSGQQKEKTDEFDDTSVSVRIKALQQFSRFDRQMAVAAEQQSKVRELDTINGYAQFLSSASKTVGQLGQLNSALQRIGLVKGKGAKRLTVAIGKVSGLIKAGEAINSLNKLRVLGKAATGDYLGAAMAVGKLFFGGGKDPAAARHAAVMEALGVIQKNQQAMLANQRVMIASLGRIEEGLAEFREKEKEHFEATMKKLNGLQYLALGSLSILDAIVRKEHDELLAVQQNLQNKLINGVNISGQRYDKDFEAASDAIRSLTAPIQRGQTHAAYVHTPGTLNPKSDPTNVDPIEHWRDTALRKTIGLFSDDELPELYGSLLADPARLDYVAEVSLNPELQSREQGKLFNTELLNAQRVCELVDATLFFVAYYRTDGELGRQLDKVQYLDAIDKLITQCLIQQQLVCGCDPILSTRIIERLHSTGVMNLLRNNPILARNIVHIMVQRARAQVPRFPLGAFCQTYLNDYYQQYPMLLRSLLGDEIQQFPLLLVPQRQPGQGVKWLAVIEERGRETVTLLNLNSPLRDDREISTIDDSEGAARKVEPLHITIPTPQELVSGAALYTPIHQRLLVKRAIVREQLVLHRQYQAHLKKMAP